MSFQCPFGILNLFFWTEVSDSMDWGYILHILLWNNRGKLGLWFSKLSFGVVMGPRSLKTRFWIPNLFKLVNPNSQVIENININVEIARE